MKRKLDWFDVLLTLFMAVVIFITLYPLYYAIIYSLNDGTDTMRNGLVFWWPRVFTWENYRMVFQESNLPTALLVTAARTVIGTVLSVVFCSMTAYPLSKKNFYGRGAYLRVGVITMYFSGGMIPFYILLKTLGLLNSFAVYILPTMFSFFNVVIFINFFAELPIEVEESAYIDGASEFCTYRRIVMPMSMPVIATIALFSGVAQWNSWYDSAFYTTSRELQTLQFLIYKLVNEAEGSQAMASYFGMGEVNTSLLEATKYATMVISILPLACVYPFLQKYFVKGMLVGSVKS